MTVEGPKRDVVRRQEPEVPPELSEPVDPIFQENDPSIPKPSIIHNDPVGGVKFVSPGVDDPAATGWW